jgi:membrane-bound lytic murein transglycosylase D
MAVNYVMRFSHEHNLYTEEWESDYLPEYDTLVLNQYVDINKLCKLTGVCSDQFMLLNTELKKNAVSETWKDYPLKFPRELLVLGKDSLRALVNIASVRDVTSPEPKASESSPASTVTTTKRVVTKTYHTVRSGESLGLIASKYGVTVTELKKWSGLKSSTIHPGQKLVIQKVKYIKVKTQTEFTEPKETSKPNNTTASTDSEPEEKETSPSSASGTVKNTYYTVRKGDYLSKIATKYGVTVSQIKSWNKMKSSTVMVGQRLIVGKTTVKSTTVEHKTDSKVEPKTNPTIATETKTEKPVIISEGNKKYYVVKSGDYLGKIATQNGTTVEQIKKWNGLSSNTVNVGQKLIVGVEKETVSTTETKSSTSSSQSTATVSTHTVKAGESLYLISKKYGVTVDELKEWNNLTTTELKVGQKLTVKKTKESASVDTETTGSKYAGKTYTVKAGDSLWSISQKFEGLTVDEIKKLNGLKSNEVKVGQVLKLG